jgi:lipopolysaccharide export system permease protein
MRAPRTLALSIAGEIALYMAVGFLGFVVILTVQNLAQRLEDLVAVGLRWRDAWALVRGLVPLVAAYSVPVGFLFGVLAAVGRMSSDSEVTAMRACGLGLGVVLAPALVFAVLVSACTAVLMIRAEPAARRATRAVLADVASRGGILEAGRFRSIGPRVLFVQSRDRENRLSQIFIADRSDPQRSFLIFAERGRFVFDGDKMAIRLELEHGDVHLESQTLEQHQRIAFERFDYTLDALQLLDRVRNLRPRELPFDELSDRIERAEASPSRIDVAGRTPGEYRAQYHRRLALPFAPLIFASLGVPLGLRRTRSARSWGVLACALLATSYYTLLTFGEYLGESGRLPAVVALWIPNAAFALAALLLLRRAQHAES